MIIASTSDTLKQVMWEYLNKHGVHLPPSADFQAIGRTDSNGALMGVVGFNGFVGNVCWIHTAGMGNWVSRELIRQTFHYPFVQVGVKYLFAAVAGNNHKALRFDRKMGFRDYDCLKDGWDDGIPLYILKMAKEDCRWLGDAKGFSHARKAA